MTASLQHWLTTICGLTYQHLHALPGDASFRRYFRIETADRSYIAMDAAMEKQSCTPFVRVADILRQQGLFVPDILASDISQGFLLLTDLGQRILLKELNLQNAHHYYTSALDALSILQTCPITDRSLTSFTREFARNELNLFQEWFLEKHLQFTLTPQQRASLGTCFDFLAENVNQQPHAFMHRDYHSANLMVLPDDQIGILDFQDAMIGPVTYDLVSLLRDCYVSWPEEMVMEWVRYFWEKTALTTVSEEEFLRWFDLMGIQRQLKALLTFSRKFHRDHNAHYLQHIPRTLHSILTITERYPECHILKKFLTVEKCVE